MKAFRSYLQPGSAKKKQKTPTEGSTVGMVDVSAAATTKHLPSNDTSSILGSRPNSLYPSGDFRNAKLDEVNDIKADVMVNYLFQQQLERFWVHSDHGEGVVLKKGRGQYTCCPGSLVDDGSGLFAAVANLKVRAAMTVNTRFIKAFLHRHNMNYVPLPDGLRLQIIPSISELPQCQRHHFAAFIADRAILVVWDDEPRKLFARAQKIEEQLMEMIWTENGPSDEKIVEKLSSVHVSAVPSDDDSGVDPEEAPLEKPRPTVLIQAVLTAITIALVLASIGSGFRKVANEIGVDKKWIRLAFLIVVPLQLWLALFFMQAVAGCIAQMFGPISQMATNSKFFSGQPPRRVRRSQGMLPHVTIQCPVYKEGLYSVIEPTVRSIEAAISTYEMQGGSANIFMNDDGMQLISDEDARQRQDFYDEHSIGWVARPKHNPKPEEGEQVFLRKGKFKKASNMNYALNVSNRVEDKLADVVRHKGWTQDDETMAYKDSLAQVVVEDEGRTWAEGNIRVGDYILLVDSDTRVPEDCFLDAVSEMETSPEVAILQYSSGVMNVTDSFFEKGITFFTNLIYTQIQYAVSNGDVAPFVGHNAILRWSALQEIAWTDTDDKNNSIDKVWSESTVSEDFDLALRLQCAGHVVRMAAYTGDGFKEGVSLTVYDELARWEKYAYGCNELIFHPVRFWFVRGPFTPLFRKFIGSAMPLPSKLTIMAYIGTYYAIGSAWILTLANYFLMGWYNGYIDHYYLDSFKIWFSIIVVFSALGNVSLAVLRYRIEERTLFGALLENFKWIPLMTVFLGGLSMHVSQALLSHMFEIDMSWGATAKEAENTTLFIEIPRLLKKFKFTFLFCLATSAGMVVCALFVPPLWRIDTFVAIWPIGAIVVGHFLLPVVLNPGLMLFTW
ncbi:MAG: hypothetical protein M1819_004740 [Sarea resinae]|nr:MAG: hypothetical protein M1819_004740 [Sarea resinae]